MAAPIYNPLAQLLADGTFSDLTVTCAGGSTFRLHRAILGAHSEYFSKACSGPFLEASTGKVDLPDMDPEVFKKLVDFVYTGTYTDFFVPNVEGLVVKAHSLPSGAWKSTMARKPPPELQEPLQSQPEAIDPPMLACVSLKAVAEQLGNLAGLMGPSVPARQGKRKADDDKGETNEIHRAGIPFPHSDGDDLASWGYRPRHIHYSFHAGSRSRQVESTLFASAKVYIIADRFMVPALKVLSLSRFSAAVAHITSRLAHEKKNALPQITVVYDAQKLNEMVDLVYANTATTDVALKEPLCRLLLILGNICPDILRARIYRLARNNSELGANLLAYIDLVGAAEFSNHNLGICPNCRKQTSHSCGSRDQDWDWYDLGQWVWVCDDCYRRFSTHPLSGFSKPRSFQWMKQERDAAIASEAADDATG